MSKRNFVFVIIGVILGLLIMLWSNKPKPVMPEQEAVNLVKSQFPELQKFPSNNLPPTTIKTEKAQNGWYVAFIINGSGRPIISAQCFFVKNDKTLTTTGSLPPGHPDDKLNLSPKTCGLY